MQSHIHQISKKNKEFTKSDYEHYKTKLSGFIDSLESDFVDKDDYLKKIEEGLCESITIDQFIEFASETAEYMSTIHYDYGRLSSKILMDYLYETTFNTFSEKVKYIFENGDFFSEDFYEMVMRNKEVYDRMIDYSLDSSWTFFAILTLKRAYLLTLNGVTIERPQDMLLRVAIQLHGEDFERVRETYGLLSKNMYTHGSPTIFNSGAIRSQLASCFLLTPIEESVEGLFDTVKRCVQITKSGGGVALDLHDMTAKGTPIRKTGGLSKGIIPYIQVLNWSLKYIGQAGNRRSGCPAIYLEPWHKDILDFLDLRKSVGKEEMRARDVFTGLWINDLFMKRVEQNGEWSLFCPKSVPGLSEAYGDNFENLYIGYEKTADRVVVPAQKIWKAIIESQIETGTPYMLYKDRINNLSNQKNLGTIRCSNLCTEIVQYTSPNEVAVCNLASICLPKFVNEEQFDFELFRNVVKIVTKNVNRVIDHNVYPLKEAEYSNRTHRPVGLGIQGLADVFAMLKLPYESKEAKELNRDIFETLYYAALEASCEEAKENGAYETFQGSPLSQGLFHWELSGGSVTSRWDWEVLRSNILKYGVRNSLLVSPMPTAGTSQIFNNNEAFEPFTSNIYTRRTSAGEFQMVNKYLMKDLIDLNLWSKDLKNLIIDQDGSIQNIPKIPQNIKDLYKTVWEIKMKNVIDLAADRQHFVDQSQSLNLFVAKPSYSILSSMHFYGWKNGLKTGMYYLRTKPISAAIKFTVDKEQAKRTMEQNEEVCESCAS
ncbi:Ribonucleoside-diphosphate reductase large chain [Nosema granulosis]|uniref:Ribonucleoside-diphosphate reductase n=1 Tax=Nosema granulosis TaxID=83296 RepID=A0A9P6GZB1_9MICR|nr:Ribonucleoside-diphosphate reductase large chain [Nosema granulosis]